jgi:AcrR family transcriptional regulator
MGRTTSKRSKVAARSASKGPKTAAAPGRPRSIELDQAILRAAFALFLEHGIAGASLEKIARRAGVAKTSIYRRWPSRDALLAQAIEVARNTIAPAYSAEAVERASTEEFLKLLLGIGDVFAKPETRRLMARLVGTVPDYPDLLEVYREEYFAPRRRALVGAFHRLQSAGLLPKATDTEALTDMLAGALIYRALLAPERGDSAKKIRTYLVRILRTAGLDLSSITSESH